MSSQDSETMSNFKGAIAHSINSSLNSIFVNKSLFCSTKPAVNPLILTGASGAGKVIRSIHIFYLLSE